MAAGGVNADFALARYNTDGSLDTSFDTDGKVITDSCYYDQYQLCPCNDQAYSVAIQADGKIVAAGSATDSSCACEQSAYFGMACYYPGGNLVGIGGLVSKSTMLADMSRESIRRPIASPSSQMERSYLRDVPLANNMLDFALIRLNPNPNGGFDYDYSFGTSGELTTDFASSDDEAHSVAIQSDGKIVAAGSTSVSTAYSDFALARYNSDGSLDTTFGTGGKVTTDFAFGDEAHSVAIQADGKIVAAGFALNINTGLFEFALARYLNFKEICSYLGDNPKPLLPDIDIFKFSGTKDETVTIRIEATNPPEAGSGKRVTLILTDKIKGTVLVKLDRSELPNEITAKLPATGKYLITVAEQVLTAKDKRYKGDYCLTLKAASPETYQTLAPFLGVE